jgi:hypothetical protein
MLIAKFYNPNLKSYKKTPSNVNIINSWELHGFTRTQSMLGLDFTIGVDQAHTLAWF